MYHYTVKVPSGGEALTAKDTIIDRIEYFNDRHHYLLFDAGNETEKSLSWFPTKLQLKPYCRS